MTDAKDGLRTALLTAFVALYFYRFGVTVLEGFFNYPFWRDMGTMMSNADFIRLRADHVWKVFLILLAPALVLVAVTLALTILGARPVPRWVFGGALACQLAALGATFAVQLPIQRQLDTTGFDAAAIERLIATDLLMRKLPSAIEGLFVLAALWTLIAAARRAERAASLQPGG